MAPAPASPVILITGATGGVGRAAAAAFAADGARLGLVGRDAGRLTSLATDLDLDPERWVAVAADLRVGAASADVVAAVEARFGRVDVLLHLVGGWTGGTDTVDLEPDVLAGMLDQHVWSTFHAVRATVPGMTARGWGRVVAVTSTGTTAPGPRASAYLAAKAGQEALVRVLAREVAGSGVTANLIAVKAVDVERRREREPSPKHAGWTTPEEVVATLRYLVSDGGDAVNGQRIALDGRG
jgi:NAD(P)-dependent dehydrogenase (short-subunit alcohol dehydrogenase family)